MNIAVFGLGYVGLVNIACLAEKGNRLRGCDIKSGKVRQLQAGESPIYEPGLQELIEKHVSAGAVSAHLDAAAALEEAEAVLVCVGTPSREDGTVELGYIRNTLLELARLGDEHPTLQHIIVRSTIPPGTMRDIAEPLFEGQHKRLYFVPEFLREGSAISDFFHSARTVIGHPGEVPAEVAALFDGPDAGPVFTVDFVTAEFIKYVDNAWHAMKVGFANEAYSIGNAYGVDIPEANAIFRADHHLNVSERYLRPGLPFGGSCLPKDVRAINALARKAEVEAPLMGAMLPSNAAHKSRLAAFILKETTGAVVFAGLTFKEQTDDLRESPLVDLARDLIRAGRGITVVDPHVNLENLRVQFPDLAPFLAPAMKALPESVEALVVSKHIPELAGWLPAAGQIIDLTFKGLPSPPSHTRRWVMG